MLVIASLPAFAGCSARPATAQVTILSYNVQNLFDGVDDGTEYREFDPENGWTDRAAFSRMERAGEVILDTAGSRARPGPDLVVLQEIENTRVLELLQTRFMKRAGYQQAVLVRKAGSAIHTGLLSRLPLVSVRTHSVSVAEARTRDLLEVAVATEAGVLSVFAAHWKSKYGGEAQTEPVRRAQAALAVLAMRDAERREPGGSAVLIGDLNESVDEAVRVSHAYPTAIGASPGDVRIHTVEHASEVDSGAEPARLFSPWLSSETAGSYLYSGTWETIDQALLPESLFDGHGLEYQDFAVFRPPYLRDENGGPLAWAEHRSFGYSDHFPILLRLETR